MNNFLNYYHFITIIISFFIIISSFMLILSVNPIHSLLFLVLIFILTTCMFLVFKVEFLSMLFLVVYLGAIIVLFLFVVMMLNIRIVALNEKLITYFPISFFIIFCFFLQLLYVINEDFIEDNSLILTTLNSNESNWLNLYNNMLNQDVFNQYFDKITTVTNLHNISIMLYTESIYIFILGSIVLLVGMLGAIMLTLQKQQKTRRQEYYNQNLKNLTKAIKIVK